MTTQYKTTFAEKVIDFNRNLNYSGALPDGFQVLNPYLDNPETSGSNAKVLSQILQRQKSEKNKCILINILWL